MRLRWGGTLPAAGLAMLLVLVSGPAAAAQERLAITNVTVVDVTNGTLLAEQTVLVEGDRIATLGPVGSTTVPEDAAVVDGTDGYLVPGLWDMHVHSVTNRAWHFPMLVAHGVTGVRNMHSSEPDPFAAIDSIQQALNSGALIGPRFVANGPLVDGPPGIWPGAVLADTPDRARAVVDSLAARGAAFIKIYDSLSPASFDALLDQARARQIPVDGHLPFAVPAVVAAGAGIRTVEHLSGMTMGCSAKADSIRAAYATMLRQPPLPFPESEAAYLGMVRAASDAQDDERCTDVAEAYRANGVAATPTLVNGRSLAHAASMMEDEAAVRLLPPAVAQEWTQMAGPGPGELFAGIAGPVAEAAPGRVRILHEAGVTLLAGTDTGNPFLVPGYSLHQELALLVEAGLTPTEALQTATLNPATVLGTEGSMGQVRAGYAADLVLLEANPLEDIGNVRRIQAVVVRGRLLPRNTLDRMLMEARNHSPQ